MGFAACEHCGAKHLTPMKRCWICHQPLSAESYAVLPAPPVARLIKTPPPRRAERDADRSVLQSSVILPVAGVAVALGVYLIAPGFLLVMAIVLTPVLLFLRGGIEFGSNNVLGGILAAVCVVVLIFIGLAAALFTVCLVSVGRGFG